jgi:hypothetical protein
VSSRLQPAPALQRKVCFLDAIGLKRNESRPECRPGSGLDLLTHPSCDIEFNITVYDIIVLYDIIVTMIQHFYDIIVTMIS